MPKLPVQPAFTANKQIKCADFNQLRDGINFLISGPSMYARQAISSTSMANVTWTTVGFDTIENDIDGAMNENGTYVTQTPGWWWITANIAWPWGNPSTGTRGTRLTVNSVAVVGGSLMTGATTIVHGGMLSRMVHLSIGDQVQVQGYQDTGGSISTILNYDASQSRSETSYITMNLITADAMY